ncbi:MAG TPA: hypothetical protein VI299_19575, partial [Polyangiales bacterium]
MATTTAAYSLQSTQFEVRAAGALHQSMRAKFVAEGATIGVVGLCYQMTSTGCVDLKREVSDISATQREQYALPNYGQGEPVYWISQADFAGNAFSTSRPVLADDTVLSAGGAAAPYSPSFDAFLEKWTLPPNGVNPRYRLIVSTYGTLNYDTDRNVATVEDTRDDTNERRYGHQTISATRAFIDIQ